MPKGADTRNHPSRQVGRPKPTPFFELNDSAQQVASDWAQSNDSALGLFATSGQVSNNTISEIDQNLNRGDTHPREKERLTNLRKHIQVQSQESEED